LVCQRGFSILKHVLPTRLCIGKTQLTAYNIAWRVPSLILGIRLASLCNGNCTTHDARAWRAVTVVTGQGESETRESLSMSSTITRLQRVQIAIARPPFRTPMLLPSNSIFAPLLERLEHPLSCATSLTARADAQQDSTFAPDV
jgi:hypothetical protein